MAGKLYPPGAGARGRMIAEEMDSVQVMYHISNIAYCSNVHAGESLADIKKNLHTFINPVRKQRSLVVMTSGLWISGAAAEELQNIEALDDFKLALNDCGLTLSSINGFPYGGFHQEQLKAGVYLPDWSDLVRLNYTQQLAEILASCLPENVDTGVISTVPLGYKKNWSEEKQKKAEQHLTSICVYLFELEQRTGKRIVLSLEMEPDCVLESTDDLINFFQQFVKPEIEHNQYLGCCYDVCHQAVMHENVYESMQRILSAGINIAKIQLSSALQVRFNSSVDDTAQLISLLEPFCELMYLHQVKLLDQHGRVSSKSDLYLALQSLHKTQPSEHEEIIWRIHFHVPIHFQHLIHPKLETTCGDLLKVFDFLQHNKGVRPLLEVETYSWQVLPDSVRPHNNDELITGLVEELRWVEKQLMDRGLMAKINNESVISGSGRC